MQVFHLAQYAFHVARAFPASCKRHDAIVAEVVAATHNAHEARYTIAADALWHDVAVGFGGRKVYVHCVVSVFAACYHLGQVQIRVGSANQIGMMVLYQILADTLCHAAQYAENDLTSFSFFGIKCFQTVVNLVFCVLSYGTSIEENSISFVFVLTHIVSCHLHHGSNHLRVCHIHLAAVCLYIEFFHQLSFLFSQRAKVRICWQISKQLRITYRSENSKSGTPIVATGLRQSSLRGYGNRRNGVTAIVATELRQTPLQNR